MKDKEILTFNTNIVFVQSQKPPFRELVKEFVEKSPIGCSGVLLTTNKNFEDLAYTIKTNDQTILFDKDDEITFSLLNKGGRFSVQYINDQSREKVLQCFKGRPYDFWFIDHIENFSNEAFAVCLSRLRSAKINPVLIATYQPSTQDHWTNLLIDKYNNLTTYDNEVLYLFPKSNKEFNLYRSKEELYQNNKKTIDETLDKFNKSHSSKKTFTYKDVGFSFRFINMQDSKE